MSRAGTGVSHLPIRSFENSRHNKEAGVQGIFNKRLMRQMKGLGFDGLREGSQVERRDFNKEARKPGTGGMGILVLFFLVSWVPYYKSARASKMRAVPVLVVASPP